MDELPRRRVWLPSGGQMAGIVLVVIALAIAIPAFRSLRRLDNEGNTLTALKTLTVAERDFRDNDRDLNKVKDYWTGDVSGLYIVTPTGTSPEIRMIEKSMANADAKPLVALPGGAVPRASYLFHALDRDDSVPGEKGNYRVDTDKSGRSVHNRERFGFCAYPEPGTGGRFLFAINELNTIFRVQGTQPWTNWPTDEVLKSVGAWD